MTAGLRLAWAELRARWGQSLLALAALALGMWGAESVLFANAILRTDVRENFLQTRPAHAILTSNDFERLDLSAFSALETIDTAEFRDFSLGRVEVYPGDWIPLWLYGVADFDTMRVALVRRQSGTFPPAPGGLLIERDGLNISDLDAGRSARVRLGARETEAPISGVAFDPGQAPATQDRFIYAYVDQPTFAALSGRAANQRLIVRFTGVRSRADVLGRIREVEPYFAAHGIVLTGVQVPDFEHHPHQWQLDTLLLLQAVIGAMALVMGLVLISQLMNALLARQVRQIAVLKAIGASRWQLTGLYAAMLALLGLSAGSIAIPLAVQTSEAFSRFVGGELNFDIHPQNLPTWTLAIAAATSPLLPILAALPVLNRALGAPVSRGLVDYGLSAPTAPQRHRLRLPSGLGGLGALAVRNAIRNRRRSLTTILMMALGVATFDTAFNVRQSLFNLLSDANRMMSYDVQLVLNGSAPAASVLPLLGDIHGVARIETWNGGRGELQRQIVSSDNSVGIVALPRDTQMFNPLVTTGRWLRSDPTPEVVLNQQAVAAYGHPHLGSIISLHIRGAGLRSATLRARFVGVVEDLDRPKAYVDAQDFNRAANPERSLNSVMFAADSRDFESVMALKRAVEIAVARSDLDVLYVMAQAERLKILVDHLNIVLLAMLVLSTPVLFVSAFGMASAAGINVQERTREIGVLRAIGATPNAIVRLVVLEGLAVSLASIALGLFIAQTLSAMASIAFGRLMLGEGAVLRYALSTSGFLISTLVTLLFGWAAVRIPAHAALRLPARDALMYG